jgi:ribonuclease P protein component
MIGRVVHKADFERALALPSRARSAHFAVHHVSSRPSVAQPARLVRAKAMLSTGDAPVGLASVDNLLAGHWLGCVVPKRHAKRSVTRSLLKRQIRAAMDRHSGALPPGLWLVRLRSPFRKEQFPSAASVALQRCAGEELDRLFSLAAR